MGCCELLSKFALIILNTVFLLVGLAPLVLGSIALADEDTLKKIIGFLPDEVDEVVNLQDLFKTYAVVFIVFGCIVVLIGLFGLFGACCKNKCLLYLYFTVLLVIIAAEVALVVIALAFPETFSEGGQKLLQENFGDYSVADGRAIYNESSHYIDLRTSTTKSLGWHSMQFGLYCCGPSGFSDYNNTKFNSSRTPTALAPITCCKHTGRDIPTKDKPSKDDSTTVQNCYEFGDEPGEYNQMGCFDAMVYEATHSVVFIAVMAGIGALELLLVVTTLVLACRKD